MILLSVFEYNGYYQVPRKEDFLRLLGRAILEYLEPICYSVMFSYS
jgi:hypothetical protein